MVTLPSARVGPKMSFGLGVHCRATPCISSTNWQDQDGDCRTLSRFSGHLATRARGGIDKPWLRDSVYPEPWRKASARPARVAAEAAQLDLASAACELEARLHVGKIRAEPPSVRAGLLDAALRA